MRTLMLALALCSAGPAWCEDIVDVLRRSQDQRLAALPVVDADSPAARTVHASFEQLMRALPPGTPAELRVISGPVTAETLHGHVIVANESLAGLPEGPRLFILAHELGHVLHQHWLQTALLYQKWVPGPVTPERTDPIAGALGREASQQAHQQEYEADAFAARTLQALGHCPAPSAGAVDTPALACHDVVLAVLQQQPGALRDSPTHPGAGKRMAALRVDVSQR